MDAEMLPPPMPPALPVSDWVAGNGAEPGLVDVEVDASELSDDSALLACDESDENGCSCASRNNVWERQHKFLVDKLRERREVRKTLRLRIFCGTWNVAGRVLESREQLEEWLGAAEVSDEEGKPPDIFSIGLQEVVELSAQNVVIDSFTDTQSRANTLAWFNLISGFLGDYGARNGAKYQVVAEHRLLGTYLLVAARDTLTPLISGVQRAFIPTGLVGRLGNKGAVAIRLDVARDTSLCFVTAHMAAHRENVAARNEEYRVFTQRPVFEDRAAAPEPPVLASAATTGGGGFAALFSGGRSNVAAVTDAAAADVARAAAALPASERRRAELELAAAAAPQRLTVMQHDMVFFMGDLNYRIAEGISAEEVVALVKQDKLETLRDMDQLNRERKAERAFHEFYEGPLCFPPSYKYIPGTRELDMRPEKKVRCPSWCDRVLWSIGQTGGDTIGRLGLERYSLSGPVLSDHLPVSALFNAALRYIDHEEEADAMGRVMSEWLQIAARSTAAVEADPPALVVRGLPAAAGVSVNCPVQLFNSGAAATTWKVCEKSKPSWLRLDSEGGVLGPGERAELVVSVSGSDLPGGDGVLDPQTNGGKSRFRRDPACASLVLSMSRTKPLLLPVLCTVAEA